MEGDFDILKAARNFDNQVAKIHGETQCKKYSTAWCREHKSVAAACHSTQSAEFNEFYKQHGITAYHDSEGILHSSDRTQFNKVLKLRGLFNRDAGYGDYSGR